MKKLLHRIFITMICLSSAWSVQAYNIQINGIYYNTIGIGNVEVTFAQYGVSSYSGDIVIPETIETPNLTTYTVTSIGDNAFVGCSGINSITLPNTITTIGMFSFDNCSGLTEIILPANLKSLGECPFIGCTSLTKVVCLSLTPPTWEKVDWDDTFDYAYIYVGSNAMSNYQSTLPWAYTKLRTYYTLSVTSSTAGTVKVSKVSPYYMSNEEVTIEAIVTTEGYVFSQWSDGNTENPRTLTMNKDYTLSAQYTKGGNAIKDIDNAGTKVYTVNGTLYIENATAGTQVAVYNLLGQVVKSAKIQEGNNSFNLASGVYLVKCDGKIVKVQL